MRRIAFVLAPATLALLAVTATSHAQGPDVGFYYDPQLALPWAECSVVLGAGAELRIPFLPVVSLATQGPVGTAGYRENVLLDVPMVLVGDGLVTGSWDAYRHTWSGDGEPLDVAGKAVLLCYDCANPRAEASEAEAAVARRVAAAASRGAAAVVLFSMETEAPFLALDPDEVPEPEIPVVTLSRAGAMRVLQASGAGAGRLLEELAALSGPAAEGAESPPSRELITRLRLRIDGAFETVETESFRFRFRAIAIPRESVARVGDLHESSLRSLRVVLGPGERPWPTAPITYFAGFDSKTFYTHHWGSGLANRTGVFLVWPGGEADPGLIAHENAHTYTGLHWGGSSSFLNEGVARHVEAEVTAPDRNHAETGRYLEQGKLPPLDSMLRIDVGSDELTPVAYPAAGSLVGYLIETRGLETLRMVYELEGRPVEAKDAASTWEIALGQTLEALDLQWRKWLRSR
jgi:hypothetical protein